MNSPRWQWTVFLADLNPVKGAEQAGLPRDSVVLAHQIRTIDKTRLHSAYGTLSDAATQTLIQQALRIHLDL